MFIERIKRYLRRNRTELTAALIAAVVVFVVYVMLNLIVWNTVSISYAAIYAVLTIALYFIAHRLLKYIITKKKGVTEKPR